MRGLNWKSPPEAETHPEDCPCRGCVSKRRRLERLRFRRLAEEQSKRKPTRNRPGGIEITPPGVQGEEVPYEEEE